MRIPRVVLIPGIVVSALLVLAGVLRLVMAIMDAPKGAARETGRAPAGLLSVSIGTQVSYLLPCTGGYLLIDTGYSEDYAHFLDGLKKLGLDARSIRCILLTHHHDDHSGFAAELKADTGAPLIVSSLSVDPLVHGSLSEVVGMKMEPFNLRVRMLVGLQQLLKGRTFGFPPVPISDGDFLVAKEDSSMLPRYGIQGTIISTPGHTLDSISVLLADGSAFCGDVAMNFLSAAGVGHNPIYAADTRAVRESWRLLIQRGALRMFPTHGKPFDAVELKGEQPRSQI